MNEGGVARPLLFSCTGELTTTERLTKIGLAPEIEGADLTQCTTERIHC